MKRITTLGLLLCCFCSVCMQAQTEFSQEGTVWQVHYSSIGGFSNKYNVVDYIYEVGADTLINGQACKKLYWKDDCIAALLEEGQKVWYYARSSETLEPIKILLYDFSKEKGDKVDLNNVPNHTNGNLTSTDFIDRECSLTVTDVQYENGRKVMTLSGDGVYDVWVEGIGSVFGFFGCYLGIPTDGSSTYIELSKMIANDNTVCFFKGEVISPDYESTFLKEGKMWELLNRKTNKIERLTLGTPQLVDNYPYYPVLRTYSGDVIRSQEDGYLFDVNGSIYWKRPREYPEWEVSEFFLYRFNLSERDQIMLSLSYYVWEMTRPQYGQYTVSKVDYVTCNDKQLKRIQLDGKMPHVWIENVGSVNELLYIPWLADSDAIKHKELLGCYLNGETIYSQMTQSINDNSLLTPSYTIIDKQLTIKDASEYCLMLYDFAGKLIYSRCLEESIETIPLSHLCVPMTQLVGKLQNKDGSKTVVIRFGNNK